MRQSVSLGGAGMLVFVSWFILEKFLFFPVAFLISTFAILFTFIKINGRPLSSFFTSFFSFFISPQLYIWQKQKRKIKENEKFVKEGGDEKGETKKITKEQIIQLAKRLDK